MAPSMAASRAGTTSCLLSEDSRVIASPVGASSSATAPMNPIATSSVKA